MSGLHDQRGVGLIEVMVSALVLAIGLLGALALQTRSLQLSQQSSFHTQATIHAQDIAERIRTNPEAVEEYLNDFGETSSSASDKCLSSTCTEVELAKWDLRIWKDNLAASLPQGDGSIARVGDQIVVTVRFGDSNGEEEFQSASFTVQI